MNQTIQSETGTVYTIDRLLGSGGQGDVYAVKTKDGKRFALKLYKPAMNTSTQKRIIQSLVAKGSPSSLFLWPLELIETDNSFGYIMPLRPPEYVSLFEIVKRSTEISFMQTATAAYQMVYGFRQLHTKGLVYRDISFGNIFINPKTGHVLICDNDNVSSPDIPSSVYGTMDFMAPEIVRGEAVPDTYTDRYSLAVLLFYLFCMNHPLNGKKEYQIHSFDKAAKMQLYGKEPVFIFDPKNSSNRPVPGYHDNPIIFWPLYPEPVQRLFIKTFTDGIFNKANRATEGEWLTAIQSMFDSSMHCVCGAEVYYTASSCQCWHCHRTINKPLQLQTTRRLFNVEVDKNLYGFEDASADSLFDAIGKVSRHPSNKNIFGLTNQTTVNWTYTQEDGTTKIVEPNKTCRLSPGVRIHTGKEEFQVL